MSLRYCRLNSLLAATILISACQSTISFGDALPSVTFGGRVYAVVSGEGFNLDRRNLTNIGVPSQSSLSDQDRFIYALDGIQPAQATVAYDDGHAVLLVERELIRALPTEFPAGTDPLASGIPGLCKYWRNPPRNCT